MDALAAGLIVMVLGALHWWRLKKLKAIGVATLALDARSRCLRRGSALADTISADAYGCVPLFMISRWLQPRRIRRQLRNL